MLREAEREARQRRFGNVEWIRGGSADLQTLGSAFAPFDLVTIGTAFHFMEPSPTLSGLRPIAADGAVVVVYNGSPMWLHADPWAKALRRVLENRLGRLSNTDSRPRRFSPPKRR
jgi:hypothetical protein